MKKSRNGMNKKKAFKEWTMGMGGLASYDKYIECKTKCQKAVVDNHHKDKKGGDGGVVPTVRY